MSCPAGSHAPRGRAATAGLSAVLALLAASPGLGQSVLYVDANAGGPVHDGSSWCSAHTALQDALADARVSNDLVTEVRVADGIYRPDQGADQVPGDREASFQLINGVAVRGGYAGCAAPDPNKRDSTVYVTILSGDLSGDDGPHFANNEENSYHVFFHPEELGLDETAALDGFTITGGNANGTPWTSDSDGGGMYNFDSNPTVTNCTFNANFATHRGGGMCNRYGGPTVTKCTFTGNSSERGGGMCNWASSPMVTNCTFSENSATNEGGGVFNYLRRPTVVSCAFTGNSAGAGGGMYNASSGLSVTNCTFSGNSAGYGGGMCNGSAAPTVVNCILWGNVDHVGPVESAQIRGDSTVVSHSCIQGLDAFASDGNIGNHPVFTDPDGADDVIGTADDDLRLLPGSPCVDAGDNQAVPADVFDLDDDGDIFEHIPFDMDEKSRFVDDPCVEDVGRPDPQYPALGMVDMGAYERPNDSMDDPDGDGLVNCADNCPVYFNPGQDDCDDDGVGDVCACALGVGQDCNENSVPDECDVDPADPDGNGEVSQDADGNGRPDECQRRLFVDDDAPLGGDGRSWDTAYRFLQDALAVTAAGDEVRVAGGTYRPDRDTPHPDGTGSRWTTFLLISGVAVRGGYAGRGVGDPDERDISAYETILSGDLDGDDSPVSCTQNHPDCYSFGRRCIDGSCIIEANTTDNVLRVVTASGVDETAVLDGFTITGGNADDLSLDLDRGGGMFVDARANPTIVNCTFRTNSAFLFGGGMYNDGGRPTLADCTFRGNWAEHGGGGIYSRYGNPTLTNCTFSENSGSHNGGGLRNYEGDPTLTNCTFSGNSAGNGGGMYSIDGNPTLTNCTFSGNSAGDGGGLYNDGGGPTLTNCTFNGNSADDFGGGGMFNWKGNPTLTNCTFSGNSARDFGGGMNDYYGNSVLTDCTFSGNEAGFSGGGIYSHGEVTLANCTFSGNAAGHYGGGMCNADGSPTLTNCTFIGNLANDRGGGIDNYGDPTLTNCTFTDNSAGEDGGGLYNDYGGGPTLTNCTFSSNRAHAGGGMDNWMGRPTLTNCTFSGNSASAEGGGMRSLAGDPTLANCTFSGNSADSGGGMYSRYGNATLTSCTFSDNSAGHGGGIGNRDGSPTLTSCTFNGNSARNGGGMYNEEGDPTLGNCTFNGNSAYTLGCGMYDDGDNSTLANSTFSGNSARCVASGGGMISILGYPTLTNCTFSGNSAGAEGGGMRSLAGNPTLANCTFSGNSAGGAGGGMYTPGSDSWTVANCILWGNMHAGGVRDQSAQISNMDGVTYSCVEGWEGVGIGNTGADPFFVDPDGADNMLGTPDDNLRVLPFSPIIDAGDNAALPAWVLTDLDGNPRFVDDPRAPDTGSGTPPIVDMGAYERQIALVTLLDILPTHCPNRISVKSRRPVPVAIVGTDTFDVMQIDRDSLVLTRADGVGGSVRPVMRKPGRGITIKDVATPFGGDLCQCHKWHGDGIDDLVAMFSMGDMADVLQLDSLRKGEQVMLTVSGLLLDGDPLEASDCILIMGRPLDHSGSRWHGQAQPGRSCQHTHGLTDWTATRVFHDIRLSTAGTGAGRCKLAASSRARLRSPAASLRARL